MAISPDARPRFENIALSTPSYTEGSFSRGCLCKLNDCDMNDHPRRPVLLLVIVLSTAACLLESWPSSAQVPTAASSSASTPPAPVRSQPLAVPTGTFLGGVPTGQLTGDVVTISVVNAISRALEHNLGVLTAEQNFGRA